MALLSGPRRVGKTSTIRQVISQYKNSYNLNWDDFSERQVILEGISAFSQYVGLSKLSSEQRIYAFDELHKYTEWRNLLE